MKKGTLYGVSLGPGDPDLITLRAWSLLESAGSWVYPVQKSGGECRALTIAQQSGANSCNNASELLFPCTSKAKELAKHCLLAARHVQGILDWGDDVYFLIEGDAAKNQNYNYLLSSLKALDQGVKSELVPGVVASPAASTTTDSDERTLAIVPSNRCIQSIKSTLSQIDTLIVPNPKPLMAELILLLKECNLMGKALVIENVGTSDERTITKLETLIDYPLDPLSLLYVDNSQRSSAVKRQQCSHDSAHLSFS